MVLTGTSLMDDLVSLVSLVSPAERGDSISSLRWTCKSLRRLAAELGEGGIGSGIPWWKRS